jgi:hypothetical protein
MTMVRLGHGRSVNFWMADLTSLTAAVSSLCLTLHAYFVFLCFDTAALRRHVSDSDFETIVVVPTVGESLIKRPCEDNCCGIVNRIITTYYRLHVSSRGSRQSAAITRVKNYTLDQSNGFDQPSERAPRQRSRGANLVFQKNGPATPVATKMDNLGVDFRGDLTQGFH